MRHPQEVGHLRQFMEQINIRWEYTPYLKAHTYTHTNSKIHCVYTSSLQTLGKRPSPQKTIF